jgi:hypothetical protein
VQSTAPEEGFNKKGGKEGNAIQTNRLLLLVHYKKTMEYSGIKFPSLQDSHGNLCCCVNSPKCQTELPQLFTISLAFINREAQERKMEFQRS